MLGFPVCVLLTVVTFKCGVSCVRWWVTSYIAFVLLDPLARSLPLLVLSFHTCFACDPLSLAPLVSSRFRDVIPLSLCTLLLRRSPLFVPLADLVSSRLCTSLMLLAIISCHLVKFDGRHHGDHRFLCGCGCVRIRGGGSWGGRSSWCRNGGCCGFVDSCGGCVSWCGNGSCCSLVGSFL